MVNPYLAHNLTPIEADLKQKLKPEYFLTAKVESLTHLHSPGTSQDPWSGWQPDKQIAEKENGPKLFENVFNLTWLNFT